ncbi:alpha-1,3-mannosyl-glycoprotein 4-beta-N-acetylglucosaminyltransferase B [Folsomia candida]|uniref:alpha-1,3-mannosyl-glycoprotein 4-beta-N-acetylglucosaminyltransferase B n=1 Tax=Folsomia candida TaxID=158441 RepID=UPI000B8F4B18|nr:alpha-1,3-mannosyl-glycoprotein 4-beta-N-acetylglucosaminyltransferase B [Folsomia candida]XP_035708846.1 alpha-1,3-mannosyl-glycoprotein 4-beta-N-acetylglucosaminyltransferase B [Folsomia candida]
MQFNVRLGILAVILLSALFIHLFWPASEEEDAETKLLRHLVSLETDIQQYESILSSVKKEIFMLKETGGDQHGPSASSQSQGLAKIFNMRRIKTHNIYDPLPHLMDYEEALIPALTLGKDREGVSVVLGIPTVKRPTQSYLLPTLQNLLSSMSPEEKNDTLIIIFIAEFDVSFVESTVNSIIRQFKDDVDSGLVEIIAPSASFYPDLKSIKSTLGDSDERTRWRTKQNLDYAYLMMYAKNRGKYYVQLEDDVLSRRGFITTMKDFALKTTVKTSDWFMLDFCQLGFIGKLFRGSDLWKLVEFILLFFKDKPGDWLLSHFFSVKYCKLDYNHKRCLRELERHWIHFKPSLFQHIGMISSLNGKVQKLKDRQFGKLELFTRHANPTARVETSIKHYGRFSLEKAYKGMNFFWGLAPQAGDTIKFIFPSPLCLKSYRFVSGNAEHPSDKLHNATFEVRTVSTAAHEQKNYVKSEDGFITLGDFDEFGVLDGQIEPEMCPISAVRITLQNSSDFWVILSEIFLETS